MASRRALPRSFDAQGEGGMRAADPGTWGTGIALTLAAVALTVAATHV